MFQVWSEAPVAVGYWREVITSWELSNWERKDLGSQNDTLIQRVYPLLLVLLQQVLREWKEGRINVRWSYVTWGWHSRRATDDTRYDQGWGEGTLSLRLYAPQILVKDLIYSGSYIFCFSFWIDLSGDSIDSNICSLLAPLVSSYQHLWYSYTARFIRKTVMDNVKNGVTRRVCDHPLNASNKLYR